MSYLTQKVKKMTTSLVVGKNIIVWVGGTTKLKSLATPETVVSISRWDNGKEVKYIPGSNNSSNFNNLVKNVVYLFEVKKEFSVAGAVLLLAVPADLIAPAPTPAPKPTPSPSPTPATKKPAPLPVVDTTGMNYTREPLYSIGNNVQLHFPFPPAFADAFKTSRSSWYKKSWDGYSAQSEPGDAVLDSKGNPTSDASNIVWEGGDGNEGTGLLIFEGKARVISGLNYISFPDFGNTHMLEPGQGYDPATNKTKARVQIEPGFQNMELIFVETQVTAPSPKNTGIKNPQLFRPVALGATKPHAETEVFNRAYLPSVADFDHLRFMVGTNWNQQRNWSARTHPWEKQTKYLDKESYFELNGAALEYQILLCNQTGKDLWLNIPHLATDEWMENAVLTILYGSDGTNPYSSPQENPAYPPLDSNLRCYGEFTNEFWNFSFGQWGDLVEVCRKLIAQGNSPLNYDGLDNEFHWVTRYVVMKTVTLSRLFRKHAGDAAMGTRFRPVYFFQYANYNDTASEGLRFLTDYYGNVGDLWGAGGAVYFNSNNDDASTIDEIFASGIPSKGYEETLQSESYWAHLYGLNYCTYEGGFAVGGDSKKDIQKEAYWDARAKKALLSSLNAFACTDGFMYTCGTYAMYKSIQEVSNSPLIEAVKEFKLATSSPPLVMPLAAAVPGSVAASSEGDGIARYYREGSRLNRLLLAPADGNYKLSFNYTGAGEVVQVLVNGFPILLTSLPSSASESSNSPTVPITLKKGLNGLVVQVKKGDLTFYKINILKS